MFECGVGYGRDAIFLAKIGHAVHGIDPSEEGIAMARHLLSLESEEVQARVTLQNCSCGLLSASLYNSMDAVYSHRTLHLMDENSVKDFFSAAHSLLKSNGVLVISARDSRDFDPENMVWVEQGCKAEYTMPSRKGHVIRFWDQPHFRKQLGALFSVESFHLMQEAESITLAKQTFITVCVARKSQG